MKDMINPDHYKSSKNFEAIDVIEAATHDAPSGTHGLLQGNALKYLYRLWRKENSLQDAKKAQWYINRLISKMEEEVQLEPHEELDVLRGRKAYKTNAVTYRDLD